MRIRDVRRKARPTRGKVGLAAVGAMVASLLVTAGATPASATQATGHDVPVWQNGWSWTYATTFTYDDGGSTHAQINEDVTYTNNGLTTFQGQDAYKVTMSGNITGGSGHVSASGINADLTNFGGSVSGTEYIRRSDLAMLQQTQHQNLTAKAKVSLISVNVTAKVDLTLTPSPGWRQLDFPLNSGDGWTNAEHVTYTGGFSYDAGSVGGSGGSDLNGDFDFNGPSSVSSQTISAGGNGSLATDLVNASASTPDGTATDNNNWSPTFKNVAKEHLQLPLDGATLTQDRTLSSASIPNPATSISETITPSLTCAGGTVTVSGALSTGASGTPVSIALDKSQIAPGQKVTASATTGAGGAYSATLTVPADSDGLNKTGSNASRANWGVSVTGGGATNAATLVVDHHDCSSLSYTGETTAPTGTNATVSAQLSNLAGGSVNGRQVKFVLSDGGGTVTANANAAGVATATLPVTGNPRAATITASYAGAGDLTAASVSTAFAVAKDPTTTSASASQASVTIGDPVTFTATVDSPIGSGPAGSVQFYVDGASFGSPVALTGGSATSAPNSTLALGDHAVTAEYLGNTTYAGSTSPAVNVHVHKPLLPTSTTETITPSTAVAGQSVNLSAHVDATGTDPLTGSVTFVEGGTTIGTAPLDASGNASIDTSNLAVGTHAIVAQYSGDDSYNASSSSPGNLTVAKADVAVDVATSDDTTVAGESVTITAQVGAAGGGSGVPTGTAQLKVDGNAVGDPIALNGGAVVFPALTSLGAGDHVIGVSYAGDGNFNSGTGQTPQHVAMADTTTTVSTSPMTSAEDQNVTVSAIVAAVAPGGGSPTGTVTFTIGGDFLGAGTLSPVAGGGSIASFDTDALPTGTSNIVATYDGDTSYGPSDGNADHVVIAASSRVATETTLTSSKNPSTYGELIHYTATVTPADDGAIGAVGGTVQFSMDGTPIGDPVEVGPGGTAVSDILGSPEPGTHTVQAAYSPDPLHTGSGDTLTQTVKDADVTLDISSSKVHSTVGEAVHFTAALSSQQAGTGTPSGFVQFSVDGAYLGDAVAIVDGVATSPETSELAPGSHTVTALYSGSAHFNGAADSLTQQVDQVGTTTALTITPSSSTYGDTVTLGATVTPATTAYGVPVGTVSFVEGGTTLASAPLAANGTTSVQLSGLPAGSHSIKAVYSGSNLFAASTSTAKTAAVAKRATNLTADAALVKLIPLGLPLGQLRATLSSSLGPVADQPVVFKIAGKVACTSTTDASGVATCSASNKILQLTLALGYTASYAGDANFLGSDAKAGIIK